MLIRPSRSSIFAILLALGSLSACGSGKSSQSCADAADGSSCSDNNPCTNNDMCQGGTCMGTPVTCGGVVSCSSASVCSPATGACVTQPLAGPCNDSVKGIPLTGCSVSDYTMPVTVGSTTFNLTFDSGSSTLAVAGSNCSNCGALSPEYTPGTSAHDTGKVAKANYGGGEGWDGEVFDDTVTIGSSVSPVTMGIASITQETLQQNTALPFFSPSYCTGSAVNNDDQGIFGVGGPGAGAINTDAYMTKLAGTTTAPIFAVQMCDMNGTTWFGGYPSSSVTASPQFTNLLDANDYYIVALTDMRLGDVSFGVSPVQFGEVIVDTGTSILLLPDGPYNTITNAILGNANFLAWFGKDFFANGGLCAAAPNNMTATQLNNALPRFSMVFPEKTGGGSFVIELPATESYLTPVNNGGMVQYCAAISQSGTNANTALTVVGNSIMHSQITIFDRQNMQIGFAPEKGCTTIGN